MSSDPVDTVQLCSLLRDLREDIKEVDRILDRVVTQTAVVITKVEVLDKKTALLSKLLTEGNGQKSVMAQLAEINARLVDLEESEEPHDSTESKGLDMARARWMAIGKIAGVVALTIPGLLSFFTH